MTHLWVNEAFGPTFQGEGPWTGRRVVFLRLAGCNLSCSWCDTPYSWDWTRHDPAAERKRMTVLDATRHVHALGAQHRVNRLVVSGGEPTLQQAALRPLVEALADTWQVSIETNGTRRPTLPGVRLWSVSPKLGNGGDLEQRRIVPGALREYAQLAHAGTAAFKFVCRDSADLDEVAVLAREYALPRDAVWIMPEGADTATQVKRSWDLADAVLERGWNLTPRLHVLLWGTERAR